MVGSIRSNGRKTYGTATSSAVRSPLSMRCPPRPGGAQPILPLLELAFQRYELAEIAATRTEEKDTHLVGIRSRDPLRLGSLIAFLALTGVNDPFLGKPAVLRLSTSSAANMNGWQKWECQTEAANDQN